MIQQAAMQLQQEKAATEADKAAVQAQRSQIQSDIKVANAEFAQSAQLDAAGALRRTCGADQPARATDGPDNKDDK